MATTSRRGDRETGDSARPVDAIENPVTGERLTFLATGRDTAGEFTRVRFLLPPRGQGTPSHFHTMLSERFEVVSGRLNVIVEGTPDGSKGPIVLGPGESASVPPHTVHRFWNATDEETVFEAEVRPSGGFERFMRASFGLARDGMTGKSGIPRNVFELGLLMQGADVYMPGPPVAVQRTVFGALASTARRLGYLPSFERSTDPSAGTAGASQRAQRKRVHEKALEKLNVRVQELATAVGWVSLGMGLSLVLAPRWSAGLIGWGERARLAGAIGAADLVIGPAILLGRDRAWWMLARAILNAVITGVYARVLTAGTLQRGRAVAGVVGMSALTLTDYFLARRLRDAEERADGG